MAKIIYSPKDIFEQEFKVTMRGFDRAEVDEFLDNVIQDYEAFLAEIAALKVENSRLEAKIKELEEAQLAQTQELDLSYRQPSQAQGFDKGFTPEPIKPVSSATNYDILKRISRLELEVFGKQITE